MGAVVPQAGAGGVGVGSACTSRAGVGRAGASSAVLTKSAAGSCLVIRKRHMLDRVSWLQPGADVLAPVEGCEPDLHVLRRCRG